MQGRTEERGEGVRSRICGLFALLCSVLVGCGSRVTVAEEAKHSDASKIDGGENEPPLSDAGKPITLCGNARCEDLNVNIMGTDVSAFGCCASWSRSACGVVLIPGQCTELNGAGHADTSCPTVPTTIGALPGCCRPDGACGSLVTSLGLGCALVVVPFVSQITKCMN